MIGDPEWWDQLERLRETMVASGAPVPDDYGEGIDPPTWFLHDTTYARIALIARLREVLWVVLREKLANL